MIEHREHWSSRIGFMMAAFGSAIGLGTLWKFPYVTGENGGGVFVLSYLFCTLFIGVPAFVAELLLGRAAQRGAVGIFTTLSPQKPGWRIIGWLGVVSSLLIISFYSVVAGWGLNYILMSLNEYYLNQPLDQIPLIFDRLAQAGGISLFWTFLFLLIPLGIVYPGLRNGVERWSRVVTSALLVILLGLFFYSMTLDGFGKAVSFIFTPDFSKASASGFLEALGLAFFTLSLGQGIMLTYGSYLSRNEDIPQTALIVGVMDVVVSLLAALMIFPIVFTFDMEVGSGSGLVFKTLPVLFAQLPASKLIATLFFTLFFFTALTSSMAFIEVLVANLIDLFGWTRRRSVLVTGLVVSVLAIPCALSASHGVFPEWEELYGETFFETVNFLVSVYLLPAGGFFASLFVGWSLKPELLEKEFKSGTTLPFLWTPWIFFMRWVIPPAVLLIFLQETGAVNFDRFISLLS